MTYDITDRNWPTFEQRQEGHRRYVESNPLWMWGDVYYENQALWRRAFDDPEYKAAIAKIKEMTKAMKTPPFVPPRSMEG
jgi:hypothetical protein